MVVERLVVGKGTRIAILVDEAFCLETIRQTECILARQASLLRLTQNIAATVFAL